MHPRVNKDARTYSWANVAILPAVGEVFIKAATLYDAVKSRSLSTSSQAISGLRLMLKETSGDKAGVQVNHQQTNCACLFWEDTLCV